MWARTCKTAAVMSRNRLLRCDLLYPPVNADRLSVKAAPRSKKLERFVRLIWVLLIETRMIGQGLRLIERQRIDSSKVIENIKLFCLKKCACRLNFVSLSIKIKLSLCQSFRIISTAVYGGVLIIFGLGILN